VYFGTKRRRWEVRLASLGTLHCSLVFLYISITLCSRQILNALHVLAVKWWICHGEIIM
jgi:hypothetical protein